MKISIFQPTYLSWLGFYKAIDWADKFIFLDDVQFENHSWQTRNRIKTPQGELMLSVPIIRKYPQKINEVKINYSQPWVKKHLKSMEMNYSKSEFFKDFYPGFKNIYDQNFEKLIDLNIGIIKYICTFLGIKTKTHFSSEFGTEKLHKNEKLIMLINLMEGDEYLYAEGAYDYMKEALEDYKNNNIKLTPLKFSHPTYNQLYGNFISHLSIIDIIFNCGKEQTKKNIKSIKLMN
jgi:hypothetical protein